MGEPSRHPTLLYSYAEYIDAADFDAIGELFEHGQITTGDEGATEARGVRDLYGTRTRCTGRHLRTRTCART